jgi:uncharacterized protein (TIGR00369 family)
LDHAALVEFFERGIPFDAWLGMKLETLEPGRCLVRVPFRPEFVGDPFRPALHGGVLSALADTAGGLSVFSTFDDLTSRVATVDLRIDYLRPGRLEDLWCEARVVRVGNRVAVTTMTVRHADPAYVAAEGRGVYNVFRPTDPA